MIRDPFMQPERLGYIVNPFKLDGDREPRQDIPKWRINKSNARSVGRPTFLHTKPCECGSLVRRVCNNKCYDCFRMNKT